MINTVCLDHGEHHTELFVTSLCRRCPYLMNICFREIGVQHTVNEWNWLPCREQPLLSIVLAYTIKNQDTIRLMWEMTQVSWLYRQFDRHLWTVYHYLRVPYLHFPAANWYKNLIEAHPHCWNLATTPSRKYNSLSQRRSGVRMLCYEDGMWKSFPHDEEYGDRWCFSLVLDMPRIPSKRLSPMEFVDMPRSKFPEPDTHRECTEGDLSYCPVKGGRNGKRRTARGF